MLTRSATNNVAPPSYTDVAIVVDRSGSMNCVGDAVCEGITELLQRHTAAALRQGSHYFIRIVSFDDNASVLYSGAASGLCDAEGHLNPTILAQIYRGLVPRGTTRLVDTTLEEIAHQAARVHAIRSGWSSHTRALAPRTALVLAVLTDGQDNASNEVPSKLCADVATHRKQFDVACQFVAANQDATVQGARFGFPPETCLQMDADPHHARAAMRCVADSSMRTMSGIAAGFSQIERNMSSQVIDDENMNHLGMVSMGSVDQDCRPQRN
jgi:hypothetical protein